MLLVRRFKATDAGRLRAEYNRLVEGLAQRGNLPCMLYCLPFELLDCVPLKTVNI